MRADTSGVGYEQLVGAVFAIDDELVVQAEGGAIVLGCDCFGVDCGGSLGENPLGGTAGGTWYWLSEQILEVLSFYLRQLLYELG